MSSTRRSAPLSPPRSPWSPAACASQGDGGRAAGLPLATEQFKIAVEQDASTSWPWRRTPGGLSANQSAALGDFTMRWREAARRRGRHPGAGQGDAVAVSAPRRPPRTRSKASACRAS